MDYNKLSLDYRCLVYFKLLMPTKDWFKANPKVSAYLSIELNQALQSWMKEHRIKKVSVGLTTILESFLGVNQDKLPVDQSSVSIEQFQELEKRIETLERSISKVDQSKPKVEPEKLVAQSQPKSRPTKIPNRAVNQSKPSSSSTHNNEWLTTKEAHEKYGGKTKIGTFRKMRPEQLKERFGLEADESRKGRGGKADKWLRKVD